MPAEIFLDSTIVVYAFDLKDARAHVARRHLQSGCSISAQVLNELVNVCRRKLRMDWDRVEQLVDEVLYLCPPPVSLTTATHQLALELGRRFGFQFYNCLIIASALELRCTTLYSEAMQHGQKIGQLTIRNPFAAH
jgi:predicted nucleic acid-binding protein